MNRKKNSARDDALTPERALEGERLLTVEETAQALGLCLDSVRRHLRSGKLQGVRVGRSWRIPQRSLLTQLGVGMAALGVGLIGGDDDAVHRRSGSGEEANTPVAALVLSSSPPDPDASATDNAQDVALTLLKTEPLRDRVRQLVAQATDNADLSARSIERLLAELDDLLV